MPKTATTTFATSNSLKAAMQAKGLYSDLQDGNTAWVSQSVQVLFVMDQSDGTSRTVASNGEFDYIAYNDPEISRVWTFRGLTGWLVENVPYSGYSETTNGANTTIAFTANGQQYTATSTNKAEALAATIIQYLSQ